MRLDVGQRTTDDGKLSQQPGGRWFKSNPRYQFLKLKSPESENDSGGFFIFATNLLLIVGERIENTELSAIIYE
jgi:hypothetical protein